MFFWLRDSGPLYLSLSFVWRQNSRSVANVQIQRLKVCLAIGCLKIVGIVEHIAVHSSAEWRKRAQKGDG